MSSPSKNSHWEQLAGPSRLPSPVIPHQEVTELSDDPGSGELHSPTQTHESTRDRFNSSHGSPTLASAASLLLGITRLSRTRRDNREWTLFGELMSNSTSTNTIGAQRRRGSTQRSKSNQYLPIPSFLPDSHLLTTDLNEPGAISVEPETMTSPERESAFRDTTSHSDPLHYRNDDFSSQKPIQSSARARYSTWPVAYRNILKCVLAYFLASLFTYTPVLSGFLSDVTSDGDAPSPSGHMVATVAVYFNPAKTIGAMGEADLYCAGGVLYSALASVASMSVYWFFETKPGWEWLADTLAICWIAVSMGIIAWAKLWMGKPSFNTACSMMAIMIFVVVVKEGGLRTLFQVTCTILLGALISNAVCLLVWPQTAATMLMADIVKTLDSFSTLLDVLTNTFLLDAEVYSDSAKLQRSIELHQSSFTSLKRNLQESKSEWLLLGRSTKSYDHAVSSLNKLAQHLGGLRSSTKIQADSIQAYQKKTRSTSAPSGEQYHANAAAMTFGELVDDLGPPVESLSYACIRTLCRAKEILQRPAPQYPDIEDFEEMNDTLMRAIYNFESTSNQAILRLYRRHDALIALLPSQSTQPSSIDPHDREEALFLVYFFVFTLQEFARELLPLIDATSRIHAFEAARGRTWKARLKQIASRYLLLSIPWHKSQINTKPTLKRSLSAIFESKRTPRAFPDIRPHAPNTLQTPSRSSLSYIGSLKQSFWTLGAKLKEPDKVYAIKAGMATAALAAPAFFENTRPIFLEYRGEWALISFFVVISPTVGATNFLSLHRIAGTLLGAIAALTIYSLFPHNPVVLSLFGAAFSAPCFWLIVVKPEYATSGRFILLTYNLTCLYCFNKRGETLSVQDVAIHRVVAVAVGCIWALAVSRFLWPSLARKELAKTLSELCANMGWFYTKLIAAYSTPPEGLSKLRATYRDADTERRTLVNGPADEELHRMITEFQAMELHLQLQLIKLQGLLAQAQHEPRLKGPFPVALYRSILTSLQSVLDRLHSMRCVTTNIDWFTSVRRDFIIPVNRERRDMVGNVLLYFSTLSSAFRLKAPLPPYLPPAEQSRRRLVKAMRELPIVKTGQIQGSRQLLYFAYALTMKTVIQELDFLGKTLQTAFGVIGQTADDFERLFAESSNHV